MEHNPDVPAPTEQDIEIAGRIVKGESHAEIGADLFPRLAQPGQKVARLVKSDQVKLVMRSMKERTAQSVRICWCLELPKNC